MVEFSKIIRKNRRDEAPAPLKVPENREPERSSPPVPPPPDKGEEDVEPIRVIKPLFTSQRPPQGYSESRPLEPRPEAHEIPPEYQVTPGAIREEDAQALYDKMIDLAQKIYAKDVDFESVDTKRITMAIAEVAGAVMSGDEKLNELAVSYILKDEPSYLLQHVVNVCIISLSVGTGLNYEIGKLIDLGMASFLHDIGLVTYEDIISSPRPLTEKELAKIKNHVTVGDKMLKKMSPALNETILTTQYEIHERLDGTGYPTGRRMIHDYAKIVSLADAFESMIHPRPFRERYSIMEVYKRIFEAKNKYDQQMIKVLVDRLGFFPNGSYVQLNTKEIGRVIAQNHKSPLRPVVRLLFDDQGERLYDEEVKDISMVRYPTLHIVKCYLKENKER